MKHLVLYYVESAGNSYCPIIIKKGETAYDMITTIIKKREEGIIRPPWYNRDEEVMPV